MFYRTRRRERCPWRPLVGLYLATLAGGIAALYTGVKPIGRAPLVIAHRGAPCLYPEETVRGYQEALRMGVDWLEMDVVSTSDGLLITRHDVTLDTSTDVAEHEEFAARLSNKTVNGVDKQGYFASDFTLQEVKTLSARQVIPNRDHHHDAENLRVPELRQVLKVAKAAIDGGAEVGVYIETKEPSYHKEAGLALEEQLLDDLITAGFEGELLQRHVILQSFEESSLREMYDSCEKRGIAPPPMVWLMGCEMGVMDDQLEAFAEYGYGIGPGKDQVARLEQSPACDFAPNATCSAHGSLCAGNLVNPWVPGTDNVVEHTHLTTQAHKLGLVVHAYTFRNEAVFQAVEFAADPYLELDYFAGVNGAGVDGVFVDCPETGIRWREYMWAQPHNASSKRAGYSAPFQLLQMVLILSVGAGIYYGLKRARAVWRERGSGGLSGFVYSSMGRDKSGGAPAGIDLNSGGAGSEAGPSTSALNSNGDRLEVLDRERGRSQSALNLRAVSGANDDVELANRF